MKCKAMAGERIRNTNISRSWVKKYSITFPNSFSSVPSIFATKFSQMCQNENSAMTITMANKIPIRNVVKRKFLQKIIFSFSMVYDI